jgi:hypothetical protein
MKQMETDQLSCAKCGHLLKEDAGACAYCGTAVASADSSPKPDENSPDLAAQADEQSVASSDDAPPVLETTEAPTATPAATSEAKPSSQSQPEETRQVIEESAAEVASGSLDAAPATDDKVDFQLPDDELIVEFDDEAAPQPKQPSAADTGSAETTKPAAEAVKNDIVDLKQQTAEGTAEVIPLAEKATAKAIPKDTPELPQTSVLEENGEASSESETLGADILELVEDEASKPEGIQDQPFGDTAPAGEAAVEKTVEKATDLTLDDSGTKNKDTDAILLTSDEAVQPQPPSSTEDTKQALKLTAAEGHVEVAAPTGEGTAKPDDSPASDDAQTKAVAIQAKTDAQASLEAAKIEKAARNKKAALAKAQALKKKKLKLAKAQALKKKKLILAKAQALKKQREAQAGRANTGKAAATGANKVQNMEANTQLLGMLKKYEGQTIGINYDNSAEIKEAELVATNAEYFSVFVKDHNLTYCHPLKTILTVIEGKDGVEAGNTEQKAKFNAVVKVYPLVLF